MHKKKNKTPSEVSNRLDHTETSQYSTMPNIKSAAPIDTQGSHSQGEALITNYWQPVTRDLSKDTLINDRISQQQASAGIVNIDPDAEFIDPQKHKGHIAQDTRTNFKYNRPSQGVDIDAEEVQSENYNSLDLAPSADLSRDILVNEHMANQLASGAIKADPDAEFIDPQQHQGHIAQRTRTNLKHVEPSGILSRFGTNRDTEEIESENRQTEDQKSSGADLSRDILVNEHLANQVASGLITTDPEAEFISLDGPNKNTKNYYYTANSQQQPPALDLTRDSSISSESFYEPQQPSNVMMIEPYPEYNTGYRRPTQNSYLRSADRYQRTPQRDLSRDIAVNDHISQQQSASGLVMIDPDAELINTDANHQNNVYYYYSYVPNNIDQVPRMKRTEPVYQFYQRPMVRYPYPQPQQPVRYY